MSNNKSFFPHINIANVFILLWVIYNFHWHSTGLFPQIESISNILLASALTISILCVLYVLQQKTLLPLIKILYVLIVVFSIYGIWSILKGDEIIIKFTMSRVSNGSYLIGALRTFLPIIACYLFTKKGYINQTTIQFWLIVFFAQAIYIYMVWRTTHMLESIDMLQTNNTAYSMVALLPLVFFIKKDLLQFLFWGVIVFAVLLSIKRGAIVITAASLLFYLSLKLRHFSRKKKITAVLLSILLIVGTFYLTLILSQTDIFQERYEDTINMNDSGRSDINSNLISTYFESSSIIEFLFGYGADATLKLGVNYAHNDWIEILIDQGLLGFSVFSLFWIAFFFLWRKHKNNELYYGTLGMVLITGFLQTLFSMWYSATSIYVTLPFGYVLAMIEIGRNNNLKKAI